MNENKLLNYLEREIEPEQTLRAYGKRLSESYMREYWCKLALNFSTYYDDLENAGGVDGSVVAEEFERLLDLMETFMLSVSTAPAEIEALQNLREEIRERMQTLYEYVHALAIYEHILSRLSYRYEEVYPVDTEAFMREIHEYINQDAEPSGMNMRIQNVYGEMPIRMTKNRFFDMVEKSCGCYRGTRSDIADYFFNDIYQQAVLRKSETFGEEYPDFKQLVADMEKLDFDAIDENCIKNSLARLQIAGQQLSEAISYGFELIELVDNLYILMLNGAYAEKDDIAETAIRCMKAYIQAASNRDFLGMDEDIIDDLEKLSDEQDKTGGMHMLLEDRLVTVRQKYKAVLEQENLTEHFKHLRLSNILAGSDTMAELDAEQEVFVTDRDYIHKKTDKLLSLYRSIFDEYPIIIRRAVISDALVKLPIAGDSLEDCEQLILQSFENCRDQVERNAAVDLLRDIMNDDVEWQE